MGATTDARRHRRREAAGVAALAALLTLAAAWPVVVHPDSRIFGAELVGRQHDPFTVMATFRARIGWSYATQPVTDYPGAALARAVGPVAAYNVVVLASFPLAVLFAWMLARDLGAGHAAATLTGLAFGFSTFHVAHAAYHPHVAQVQWIPLYLLALWRSLEGWTWRRSLALAGASMVVVLSNFYAGLIVATLTPAVVLVHAAVSAGDRRHVVRTSLVLATIALAGLGYAATAAPWLFGGAPPVSFPAEAVAEHGALWQAYLLPAVEHPIFGGWSREALMALGVGNGAVEQQVGLAWSLLALAGAGLMLGPGTMGPRGRRVTAVLVALGLAAWFCSLAPGQRLGPVPLPAPAAWLHEALPMFRAFARFAVVVTLVVAVLAGVGWSALLASPAKSRRVVAWLLAAGVAVELWPLPWRSRDVLPTEAHRYVADLSGPLRVFDSAPLTPEDVMVPIFMGHDVIFSDGPDRGGWDPGVAARLSRQGITHMIVRHGPAEAGGSPGRALPPGLTRLRSFADSTVLRVDGAPGPRELEITGR